MSPKPVKNSHIQSNSRCKKIQKDYRKQTKPETQGVSATTTKKKKNTEYNHTNEV